MKEMRVSSLPSVSSSTKHNGSDRLEKITDLRSHPDAYVTTADLAAYWGVSRKQIYKQIEAGTLNAIRLGPRLLRIQTAEAIRFEDVARMVPIQSTRSKPDRLHEKTVLEQRRKRQ
jgi:excisionase family DNA binding protein